MVWIWEPKWLKALPGKLDHTIACFSPCLCSTFGTGKETAPEGLLGVFKVKRAETYSGLLCIDESLCKIFSKCWNFESYLVIGCILAANNSPRPFFFPCKPTPDEPQRLLAIKNIFAWACMTVRINCQESKKEGWPQQAQKVHIGTQKWKRAPVAIFKWATNIEPPIPIWIWCSISGAWRHATSNLETRNCLKQAMVSIHSNFWWP